MCPIFKHQIFWALRSFVRKTDVDLGTLRVFFKRGQWSPSFVRQQDTNCLFSGRTGARKIRTFQDTSHSGTRDLSRSAQGEAQQPHFQSSPLLSTELLTLDKFQPTVWFWRKNQSQLSLPLGIFKALHGIGAGYGRLGSSLLSLKTTTNQPVKRNSLHTGYCVVIQNTQTQLKQMEGQKASDFEIIKKLAAPGWPAVRVSPLPCLHPTTAQTNLLHLHTKLQPPSSSSLRTGIEQTAACASIRQPRLCQSATSPPHRLYWFSPFLTSFLWLLGNQQKKSKRTCDKHVLLPLDYTHSGHLDLQTSNSVSWTADKHRERPKSYPALLSSQPTFSLCTVHEICYCTVWGERELTETRCIC